MKNRSKSSTVLAVIQALVSILVIPLAPLLISGRWGWWEAWAFAALSIGGFIISRLLAAKRNPDIIAERAQFGQQTDAKPWDKILAPLVGLGGGLVPVTAGVEALLGQQVDFSLAVELAAGILMLAAYIFSAYALIENRFFSGVVRIQKDRGQRVISSGPYRWVRHPGYAGALITYLAIPFFLDSVWAFVPAVIICIAMVIRTRLEDETLQAELEGYRAYTQRVRYRLIPGVW